MRPPASRGVAGAGAVLGGLVCLWLQGFAMAAGPPSDLHRDEEIVLFPALAHRVGGGGEWECEVRGCVYEPEQRRLALALLREALELKHVEMTGPEAAIFAERARLFMVDHERGRRVVVRIGGGEYAVGKSRPDGQFAGVLRLPDAKVRAPGGGPVPVQAVLPADDPRRFLGQISLVEKNGVTVITDIDDTIKVSEVRDRKALLRRTFLEPFEPVPGMAEVYRAWAARSGAQFCYVSASPWQLFPPLAEFVRANGFPAGVFYLKKFRWKDESFAGLFEGPEKYKPAAIEPLLKQFPRRQFVLVGDAGEKDPEIYGSLGRRYPRQVARILIRNVTGPGADSERFKAASRGLRPGVWQVFRSAGEIEESCPAGTAR